MAIPSAVITEHAPGICRDSGNKTIARGASAFCEHPWKRMLWISCRVSGTGSRRNRPVRRTHPVPLTRHNSNAHRDQGCSQKTLAPLATVLSR
jgi:hypothetical protein